ncbi:MAG: DnaB-like helicase C-terminal domain-containing protein, partial [Chitinophagales bacterium]
IPIIALSQLSRKVEDRGGNKRPILSDLRESGAIEQDADLVCFLYRPEYYGFDEDEEGNPTKGVAEVIVAKHRNGALDKIRVRFIDQYIKFVDMVDFPKAGNFSPLSDHLKETKATIIRKSKMDDMKDEDLEEPPF